MVPGLSPSCSETSSLGRELDLDVAPIFRGHREQLGWPVREPVRQDLVGNLLDARIERGHGVVVELATVGDLILEIADTALELQEGLIRLEVRIALGHREQLPQRLADLMLGSGPLAQGPRL